MSHTNEVKLSGVIGEIWHVKTKTGATMVSTLLSQDRSKFKIVAFGNIAEALIRAGDGASVLVSGSASINSWKGDDDRWRNEFQLSAWEVEIDGKRIAYAKDKEPRLEEKPVITQKTSKPEEPPLPDDNAFRGGPF